MTRKGLWYQAASGTTVEVRSVDSHIFIFAALFGYRLPYTLFTMCSFGTSWKDFYGRAKANLLGIKLLECD